MILSSFFIDPHTVRTEDPKPRPLAFIAGDPEAASSGHPQLVVKRVNAIRSVRGLAGADGRSFNKNEVVIRSFPSDLPEGPSSGQPSIPRSCDAGCAGLRLTSQRAAGAFAALDAFDNQKRENQRQS
eukprot:scaffold57_cov254-Pinguiococcus_pyrenoidosus.AAC.27